METWYILFEGTSVDGRGGAHYVKRTMWRDVAQAFLCDEESPYSTSYVLVVTDTYCRKEHNADAI